MAEAAPLIRLVLVGEADDLGALRLAHDLRLDGRALELIGRRQNGVAVDDHHDREVDFASHLTGELDVENLTLGDPILLAARGNDCIHREQSLPSELALSKLRKAPVGTPE